jgi:hypothetical protein
MISLKMVVRFDDDVSFFSFSFRLCLAFIVIVGSTLSDTLFSLQSIIAAAALDAGAPAPVDDLILPKRFVGPHLASGSFNGQPEVRSQKIST